MLENEYKYYENNKTEFLDKYFGRFLLIKNTELIGAYASEEEAYENALKNKFEVGTFLIQECKSDEALKQTFNSRVLV